MFDNLGTALVQAIGFFGVFSFFVYQLLSEGKILTKTESKDTKKSKDKIKKKGLFGRKKEPIKDELKKKKKRIFGRKEKTVEVLEKATKKGWFK